MTAPMTMTMTMTAPMTMAMMMTMMMMTIEDTCGAGDARPANSPAAHVSADDAASPSCAHSSTGWVACAHSSAGWAAHSLPSASE
eukprot:11209651-Lingulodinium_polyedra.AAC.1